MSMISELVAQLRRYSQQAYNNYEEDASKELKQAADLIEELSAKLAVANMERSSQHYNGGWIPVSSGKMPEHRQRVFITIRITGNRRYVTTADYYTETGIVDEYDWDDEGFYSYDSEYGYCKYVDVIAWMPTDPYKGVE